MKKLKLLTLLPLVALCACSSTFNPVGTYSFMLGKQSETHVRIALNLSDEDYIVEDKTTGQPVTKGKKFKAELDTGAKISVDISEWGITLPPGIKVEEINKFINDLLNDLMENLNGYYNVSDYVTTYGNRLKLGMILAETKIGSLVIPETAIEYLVASYIDSSNITLQIPVSKDDVLHQLTWYGHYFNFSDPDYNWYTKLDETLLPGESDKEKRFGTHPVTTYEDDGKTVKENQVEEMNTRFSREFSNTPVYIVDKDTGKDVLVGKISETVTTISQEGKEVPIYTQYFHSCKVDETLWVPEKPTFECVLKTKNNYGVFDTRYVTSMNVDITPLKETGVGKIIYIYDNESTESAALDRTKYMQEPFTFRDFHDIKMKLAKE